MNDYNEYPHYETGRVKELEELDHEYDRPKVGWECPACHKIMAPFAIQCISCNSQKPSVLAPEK